MMTMGALGRPERFQSPQKNVKLDTSSFPTKFHEREGQKQERKMKQILPLGRRRAKKGERVEWNKEVSNKAKSKVLILQNCRML